MAWLRELANIVIDCTSTSRAGGMLTTYEIQFANLKFQRSINGSCTTVSDATTNGNSDRGVGRGDEGDALNNEIAMTHVIAIFDYDVRERGVLTVGDTATRGLIWT